MVLKDETAEHVLLAVSKFTGVEPTHFYLTRINRSIESIGLLYFILREYHDTRYDINSLRLLFASRSIIHKFDFIYDRLTEAKNLVKNDLNTNKFVNDVLTQMYIDDEFDDIFKPIPMLKDRDFEKGLINQCILNNIRKCSLEELAKIILLDYNIDISEEAIKERIIHLKTK